MAPRSKISRLPPTVKAWLNATLADNECSEYQLLSDELKARGFDISRSAVHRYGQEFEDRLMAIKIATEQARAITEAAPDKEGALSGALTSLVQQRLFKVLVDMQLDTGEGDKKSESIHDIGLTVARLSNATVKQKKFAEEMREQIRAEERAKAAEQATSAAKAGGASPETISRIRAALGIET